MKNIMVLYAENEAFTGGATGKRILTRRYTKNDTIIWTQELLTFGRETRNGNTFDKQAFMDAIASPFVAERLKGKRFYGELDHPPKDDFARFTEVSLKCASHRINKLWFEGDTLFGEFETMESEYGKTVRAMIEQDAEIACSFRGFGLPKPDGTEEIVILCWDIVFNPSDPTSLSKEDTFQNKLYAEGYTPSQIAHTIIGNGGATYTPIETNSRVYAESSKGNITVCDKISYGESVIGYSYKTPTEIKIDKDTKSAYNFLKNI